MTKAQGKPNNQVPSQNAVMVGWPIDDGGGAMVLRDGDGNAVKKFDLEERTALFGEAVVRIARKIPQNLVNNRLITQLVGAATSIGANYCEADNGVSKKDFMNRIGTCRKEAKETKFFLRMIAAAEAGLRDECRALWQEARELHLVFCAIYRK